MSVEISDELVENLRALLAKEEHHVGERLVCLFETNICKIDYRF